MLELIAARYVYVVVLVLLSVGLYGMLAARNLVRKVIAMTIFQTAIYLFFIEGSVKRGGTVPVIDPALGTDPVHYVNPLPHLLILTARPGALPADLLAAADQVREAGFTTVEFLKGLGIADLTRTAWFAWIVRRGRWKSVRL